MDFIEGFIVSDKIQFFNHAKNQAKALDSLLGILNGIDADSRLVEHEINYLLNWLNNQDESMKTGDFLDIEDCIQDILDDGVITQEEKDDLQQLIRDVITYNSIDQESIVSAVNQCIGFIQGITCDDNLTNQEIVKLVSFINSFPQVYTNSVLNLVKSKVDSILEDNFISDNEREELLDLLKKMVGQEFMETGVACGNSMSIYADSIPFESMNGLSICFSGSLVGFSRAELHKIAKNLGASVKGNVSKKLDLLVVGAMASEHWKFGAFGCKVERAIQIIEDGEKLYIIDENMWNKLISN